MVRNPYSIRPYQHVLEPVMANLMIAKEQYENRSLASSYNIGPDESDCRTIGDIVQLFCDKWNVAVSTPSAGKELNRAIWRSQHDGDLHEANFLKLDCSKLKTTFGWGPVWNIETAMEMIVEWTTAYLKGQDVTRIVEEQIETYMS